MIAIQLGSGKNGFGVHTFLPLIRNFPHLDENFVTVMPLIHVETWPVRTGPDRSLKKNFSQVKWG
jgi:hypothetical protein